MLSSLAAKPVLTCALFYVCWVQSGWTALHWSARRDRANTVKILLAAGATANAANKVLPPSILHVAMLPASTMLALDMVSGGLG